MLYKIARKLTKDYLDGLSFADRTGGLVRTMLDNRKGEKSYPVENNQDKELGDKQYMRRLVPDSNLTSLMYWEVGSPPTVVETHNRRDEVEASLKLVCWFNYQKVDPDMYDPAYLIAAITNVIPFHIGNFECLAAVTCTYAGQDANDGGVFTKYTYNEPESQFYKYPYDYFVLNFDVSYWVVKDCHEKSIASLPVSPVMIYASGNADKVFTVAGVSGREYQFRVYAGDETTLRALALHEFSGENQNYEITPKVGQLTIFRLDYGREYLTRIDMPEQGVTHIVIPSDLNIRLSYVDLSENNIISEGYLMNLINHIYDTEVNEGYLDISGGTNAPITFVNTLAKIDELINDRGWEVLYNV